MTAGTRSASGLIGRNGEQKELVAGLDASRTGTGRLFLLTGEAGIGKTRLAEAVAEAAASAGIPLRWGRCRAEGGAPPYWPWSQILRAELAELGAGTVRAELGPSAARLLPLVPELAQQLPDADRHGPSALPGARLALFEAVTDLLLRRCRHGGLVLALEDLHCADEASLRLLQFVIEELPSCPVMLLATFRDAELRGIQHEQLATLARRGRRLRLGGLDEEGVAELLEATTPVQGADDELARPVLRATDGNPFFVQEMARLLLAERDPTAAGPQGPRVPLTHDVRQLLRYRLAPLPADVRDLLTQAAVLGEEFDLPTIVAVHGGPTDVVVDALATAVDLQVLQEVAPGRWSFLHGLVRDALYQELRPSARVALHRRAGRAIEAQVSGDASSHAFELAHHFFQAARGGDGAAAVDANVMAGDLALAALAFEEAAGFYGQALEAVSLAAPVDERRRYAVLVALAGGQERAGDVPQAAEAWRRALTAARRVGAADLLAEAAIGYAGTAASSGDTRSVLEEARAAMSSADSALLARLLVKLAVAALDEGRVELGRELAEQALAMAARIGDDETTTAVLSEWRGVVASHPDLQDQRLEVARQLLELAEDAGDRERIALAHQWIAADLFAQGDMAETAVHLDTATQEADTLRSPFLVWGATAQRVALALLRGQFEDAARLADETRALGRRLERPGVDACFEAQMRRIAIERGRFDDVAGAPMASGVDCRRSDVAVSLFHLGRHDEARRLLADMLPADSVPPSRLCCVASLAEVCWLLGDADRATTLSEVLARHPDVHVVEAVSGCSLGASSLHLGQLAALQGRFDEAEAQFAAAHRLHERMGAPAWLARSRADEARMLVARGTAGDLDRARELARAAAEGFSALGMEFHAALSRSILTRDRPEATGEAVPALDRARLVQEGDYWAFEYGGAVARLRDSKGVRYLVALLRQPGQELHALDLVGGGGAGDAGDGGAVFTPEAKAAYRRRLEDLREELDDATADNDLERASRAREQMDSLLAELSAAVGRGGGDRRAASEAERARQSVTRAVKGTVARLAEANAALGLHLRSTVRTGIYSAYVPDPRAPIVWEEAP